MELILTLRTTAAIRAFTDEPVADSTVHAVLDDARFAPSGGNRQPWRVAVVRDPAVRGRLGDLMRPVWHDYVARRARRDPVQLRR
jgi:nitroreductase